MPDSALLTVAQAALRLGVSPARVRMWLKQGRVQGERIGRDWVVRAEGLARPAPKPAGRPFKAKG